jgi:hypothetical protein
MERIGEWLPFSKAMYARKVPQYNLVGGTDWERLVSTSLMSAVTSVAPFGGPIAVSLSSSAKLSVFAPSGRVIQEFSIPLDGSGSAVAIGWTKEESIMLLTSRNHVLVYELSNVHGASSSTGLVGPSFTFKLIPVGSPSIVAAFAMRPSGAIFVIQSGEDVASVESIIVEERKDPQASSTKCISSIFHSLKGTTATAVEYLPNDATEEDESLVYLGTSADKRTKCGTVVVVYIVEDRAMDTKAKIQGGVQAMRINPTSEQIVILSGTGTVTVSPLNLESSRLVINFGLPIVPSALHWAGPRFVALSYKCSSIDSYYSDTESPIVTILIPADESSPSDVKFERLDWDQDGGSGWCCTVQEVDGMRVVTDSSYLFIEDVPPAVVDLCQLKPTSEVGKFAHAYRQMSSGNVSGLTTIRDMVHRLKGNFEQRVIEPLLDAALGEFSAVQQESILAAAADAKSRCNGFDTERYVDVVRRLRALNTLRRKENGLPLSTRQYAYLSGSESLRSLSPSEMQVILDRLVNRGAYQLAFDISTALKQRSQKILIQWSCALVQDRTVDDVTLAHMIAKVMSQHSGASYIEAARAASLCGRQTLAIHLLQQEQRAQQQVFLLMQMGQEDLALQKACESDEVDLIILVLCKLIAQRSEQQILNAFSTNPKAQQWLTIGSMYFRPWRKIHRRLLEDTNKCHQQGYRELHRILTNDRDGPASAAAAADASGPLGDKFDGKSSRGDRAASSSDSNPADDAEADEYDELEELRDATDDEEDAATKKSSSGITDIMGDLFKKKDKKKSKGEDAGKSSKKTASKSEPELAIPAAPTGPIVLDNVPIRRRIDGTNIITSDDMIHLCGYFTPNSPAELDGKWCRNHMALLEEQRLLVEETGMEMFMNQSVIQTVELCYRYDMDSVAERIVKKFHVNDKKFAFAKLRALCSACRWTEVDKMFGAGAGIKPKSFKSCIGFGPIISTLHQYDRQQQAAQFVPRLEDVCQRVEWYVKLDAFQAAIDDAFSEESPELIQQVLKKARNPTIVEYGNRKLKELQ